MVRDASPESLWIVALKDAGLDPGQVALVELGSVPTLHWQGRFMPPGERDPDISLNPEELARVNADAALPRVVLAFDAVPGRPDVLLGLMRHHLEYARIYTAHRHTYALALSIASALYPVYRDAGRGSATLYNAIPMMRLANMAAARLVLRSFNERDNADPEFSALLRLEDPPYSSVDIAPAHVVFGAIWAEALDYEVAQNDVSLDELLARSSAESPALWRRVREDETFRSLAFAAASFRPTAAEVRLFEHAPALAWRTAIALVDRATRFGLRLLLS